MKRLSLVLIMIVSSLSMFAQTEKPLYLNTEAPIEQRIEDALSRMTIKEKIAMLHAHSTFSSAGVPRLGIPENYTSDGPHGIRAEMLWGEYYNAKWTNDSCIAFPALTALAASWNPKMAALYGQSIGEEARYRNKNILLGPGVNIYRTPLNGRNFEYMGEDPYLASVMVVPYIQGVQKNGVAACVKHFALNNQGFNRGHINVKVDDRALHEIYLPAFKAAVQTGNVWAVMGAYNQYQNEYVCHNRFLLTDLLKKCWGFDGVVISDWGAAHNTHKSIYSGLDMEFGSWESYDNYYLATPYMELIRKGEIGTEELDDKVRRILRLVFRTTMDSQRSFGSFGTQEHALAGKKIAEDGMVLLKNDGKILPLNSEKIKNILIVGENAKKRMTIGGGSSSLKAKYEVSPLAGIQARVGKNIHVQYLPGYVSPIVKEQDVQNIEDVEQPIIDIEKMQQEAEEAAKQADVVIFIGGLNKNDGNDCEGEDRKSLDLPYGQNKLITRLSKANPNTVVVMISGNAVSMPWVKEVSSIIQAWYGGTEAGNALAAILFGDVNPSGKLPMTFPAQLQDNGAHALNAYPGDSIDVIYKESLFVGYRWTDKHNITPLFAFGHGLSYTTFQYGKLIADKKVMSVDGEITFTVKVKNSGEFKGAEVVQLYISDKKASLPRPLKELKGFQKIELKKGEEQTVSFTITKEALSFYDDRKSEWSVEKGVFEALVGSSSSDIRSIVTFELK